MNKNFTHLHVHNEYSVLDGYGSAELFVRTAKEKGFRALALTNHANIDGLLEFQRECDKQGISPIMGCELYIVPDITCRDKNEKRRHINAYIKNQKGFKTLNRLLTIANTQGFYKRPRISYQHILGEDLSGLIFSTACAGSFIMDIEHGEKFLKELITKTDVYFEIMPHAHLRQQTQLHERIRELYKKGYKLKIIATNDCHYPRLKDNELQEILLAIQSNKKFTDKNRWKFEVKELYLKTYDEMFNAFKQQNYFTDKQIHTALQNTQEIVEKCGQFRIKQQPISLPKVSEPEAIKTLCRKKLNELQLKNHDIYFKRLESEIETIESKNFEQYFMIVYDLVKWCREQGIMTGPGRGSVGGSLVAYLLGITTIDPVKHNLLFSRFINEERNDLPDIDIDFEDTRREDVRQYLHEKYKNVAGVGTFLTMKARGIIRDVSRAFDIPLKEVDIFAKSIVDTIAIAIKETDEGKRFQKKYPDIIKYAIGLEGGIRAYGQHAAALVISNTDLYSGKQGNICLRRGQEVINWPMGELEYMGLIKLDILGLNTLSVIKKTLELAQIELPHTFNNEKVYTEIANGNTVGCFQISTYLLKKLCEEAEVENFNELCAVLALGRPGPLQSGMTEDYIKRKHGKKWKQKNEVYEHITKDTYGVLVYQEQIMQVIHQVAGLSYSAADNIRKVIGKKRGVEEFEPYRVQFLKGCEKTKIFSQQEAEEFWEGLLKWANYGFCKCLSGDTLLTRSSYNQYSGKHISVADLYLQWNSKSAVGDKYRSQGLDIMQMSQDNRCRPGKIIGVYYQGKKQTYKIITQSGKNISATGNHKLYTYDGYVTVSELKIRDRLAVMGQRQESITEKRGQKWRKTNTKGKCGFQKGADNPAYIDGRFLYLKSAKQQVMKRAKSNCEHCGRNKIGKAKYEFAHIKSIQHFNEDYSRYHSKENLLFLCNSCHKKLDYKKQERKKRYNTGYPIYFDPIIKIEKDKIEDVFDIEMEGPNHNFIANDIVSHNSHATGYAMLAYYTAWLKTHYPAEFICALLTYGSNAKKDDIIKEAIRLGIQIIPPKIQYSHPIEWKIKENTLYVPFIEIKGIGEKTAYKCIEQQQKKPAQKTLQGFFNKEEIQGRSAIQNETKIQKILREIQADNSDVIPQNINKYFVNFKLPKQRRK